MRCLKLADSTAEICKLYFKSIKYKKGAGENWLLFCYTAPCYLLLIVNLKYNNIKEQPESPKSVNANSLTPQHRIT